MVHMIWPSIIMLYITVLTFAVTQTIMRTMMKSKMKSSPRASNAAYSGGIDKKASK